MRGISEGMTLATPSPRAKVSSRTPRDRKKECESGVQGNTSCSHQPLKWCRVDVSHRRDWWGGKLPRQKTGLKKTYGEVCQSKPLEDAWESQFAEVVVIVVGVHDQTQQNKGEGSPNHPAYYFRARDRLPKL